MRRTRPENARLNYVAFVGANIPLMLFGTALVCAGVAFWTQHYVLAALSSWFLLQFLVFVEIRFRKLEFLKNDAELDAPFEPPKLFESALVVWLLPTTSFALAFHSSAQTPSGFQSAVAIGILLVLFALVAGLLRYFQHASSDAYSMRSSFSNWCRASIWMVCVALLSSILLSVGAIETQKYAVQGMMILSIVPVLEWLTRTLISENRRVSIVADVRVVRLIFSRLNPIQSALDRLDKNYGIDIRSTWALYFIRRALGPIFASLVFVGWLSTSIVSIDTFQAGIHERFGAPTSKKPLGPGLHLVAPWPIDVVHRIEASRIRSMPLGYYGPKAGASLLWTKQHAAEEHNLLLGDGRDLVTINAILQYKVGDPWAWHYNTQNPEEMLRVAAEQALLKNTVSRSLDDALSENTSVLARKIEDEVRQRVADYEIGAEIIGLSFQGLHPPISVAKDYQAVVSAQHEREIAILKSRSYEIRTLQAARSKASDIVMQAKSAAFDRIASSRGEADAFRTLQQVHSTAPVPFEQHQRLKVIEKFLDGRPFILIDDRIEKEGGILWFQDN